MAHTHIKVTQVADPDLLVLGIRKMVEMYEAVMNGDSLGRFWTVSEAKEVLRRAA